MHNARTQSMQLPSPPTPQIHCTYSPFPPLIYITIICLYILYLSHFSLVKISWYKAVFIIFSLYTKQIEVKLIAIKAEFNSGSAFHILFFLFTLQYLLFNFYSFSFFLFDCFLPYFISLLC